MVENHQGTGGTRAIKNSAVSPAGLLRLPAQVPSGCIALGTARTELADVALPPAVAAGKIDGVLKGDLFFTEQGLVNFEHRIKHRHGYEPG